LKTSYIGVKSALLATLIRVDELQEYSSNKSKSHAIGCWQCGVTMPLGLERHDGARRRSNRAVVERCLTPRV
jgi:hypothetical protein